MILSLYSVILVAAASSTLASPLDPVSLGGVAAARSASTPIPNSQRLEDGFYRSYHNDAGELVHEKLSDITVNATEVQPLFARDLLLEARRRAPSGSAYCGCGFELNHGECDVAVAELRRQVERDQPLYINSGQSYHTIYGGTVAFACNRESGGIRNTDGFHGSDVGHATGFVTNDCGWYIAGTHIWGYHFPLAVGYMRYAPGVDFCHGALTSNQWHC